MTIYVVLALLVWALLVGRPRFYWCGVTFWPWDVPCNSVSIWFARRNLGRLDVGWNSPKQLREDKLANDLFWWAILGFSGTVTILSWPGYGFVRDWRWRRFSREPRVVREWEHPVR